jgi:CYTH domain-containing protein
MSKEIELKFLVEPGWEKHFTTAQLLDAECLHFRQGYLARDEASTVRIRLSNNKTAYLTIKGARIGLTCDEYEYEIPYQDGLELFEMCGTVTVIKTRYAIKDDNDQKWEIDIFEGINEGLIMAELEIPSENHLVTIPDWIGRDVSADYQYTNAYMATHKVLAQ